jgi:hypothetical protein
MTKVNVRVFLLREAFSIEHDDETIQSLGTVRAALDRHAAKCRLAMTGQPSRIKRGVIGREPT